MTEIRLDSVDIYGQDKAIAENNSRICQQDYFINSCLWLGVPISKDILYKYFCSKKKLILGY